MFESELTQTSSSLILENERFSMPIDEEVARGTGDSGTVTFGVRPQHIHVSDSDGTLFTGSVKLAEPQGDRDTIYFHVNGHEIRAVVTQNTVTDDQDEVPLDIERDKFWVLDKNGDRLF